MALSDVCKELNNYFPQKKYFGIVTISDGAFSVSGESVPIQTGQYFRIVGSVFNDGIYPYPTTLKDEEPFGGAVWVLKIPQAVVDLSNDIDKWVEKYAGTVESPFQSESFGGYSYSKATTQNGSTATWRSVFKGRLDSYRRMSNLP